MTERSDALRAILTCSHTAPLLILRLGLVQASPLGVPQHVRFQASRHPDRFGFASLRVHLNRFAGHSPADLLVGPG